MQRHKKTNKATKQIIAMIVTAIVLCAMAVVPAFADRYSVLPVTQGTLFDGRLTSTGIDDIYNCFQAQLQLNSIRTLNNSAEAYPRLVCMWEQENGRKTVYYAIVMANNQSGISTQVTGTTLKVYPASACALYAYDDSDNGGWKYCTYNWAANSNGNQATISTTGILCYTNTSGNLVDQHTSLTGGTVSLTSGAASSWSLAASVKTNGLPENDGAIYTQEQYNAYGTQRYNAGRTQGRLDVQNEPDGYGLFTQQEYNSAYTAGQTYVQQHPSSFGLYNSHDYNQAYNNGYSVGYVDGSASSGNVTLDIPSIVNSVTTGVGSIWSGFMLDGTQIFGISIATICGAVILITVVIWFVHKVR